jgi:hypothetical protein
MFCFPVDKTETHSRTLSEQNDSDDEKGAKVKSKDVENEWRKKGEESDSYDDSKNIKFGKKKWCRRRSRQQFVIIGIRLFKFNLLQAANKRHSKYFGWTYCSNPPVDQRQLQPILQHQLQNQVLPPLQRQQQRQLHPLHQHQLQHQPPIPYAHINTFSYPSAKTYSSLRHTNSNPYTSVNTNSSSPSSTELRPYSSTDS